jgi:hypothetical protein
MSDTCLARGCPRDLGVQFETFKDAFLIWEHAFAFPSEPTVVRVLGEAEPNRHHVHTQQKKVLRLKFELRLQATFVLYKRLL